MSEMFHAGTKTALAHLNVADPLWPLDDPRMSGFTSEVERVNELARQSAGFLWQMDELERTDETIAFPEHFVVNISVWRSVEDLRQFTFRGDHALIMKSRRTWFHRPTAAMAVLWWISSNQMPSELEARRKLDHLRTHGPSVEAFDFRFALQDPEMNLAKSQNVNG